MSTNPDSAIIVGGGVIGIACAHYLAGAGMKVTVIDQATIGAACSHANCGYVCPSHVLPLNSPDALAEGFASLFSRDAAFRIKPQLRLGLYRWLFEFARRCTHTRMIDAGHRLQSLLDLSRNEYRGFFESCNVPAEWRQDGLLYVFGTPEGLDRYATTHKTLDENYGVVARRLEGSELTSFDESLKSDLAGAFYYPNDATLRPDKLMQHWRSLLTEMGVEFIEQCAFENLQASGSRIQAVTTSRGELAADHFVFAAGAWSSKLANSLRCQIPVEPGKGYSVTMQRPDLSPQHSMLFPEHHIGVTPFEDSFRIGSIMEFVGFDTSIPKRRLAQLRDSARAYLRTDIGEDIEETWYGWRPMTWDSLPIIGRVPGLSNGVLATGHNMLGLTLAPATGRLVSELVLEQPTVIDVEAYSPARF